MAPRSQMGRLCEYLVKEMIERRTGFTVLNANDKRVNYPIIDLIVDPDTENKYYVSVKAKAKQEWPSVRGVQEANQYMVFISLNEKDDPDFYVLSNQQWFETLRQILPRCGDSAEIVNGAIEWNWEAEGEKRRRRGALVKPGDIARYKDNWSVLPGVNKSA
jgi:hypothetical protein